MRYIDLFVRDGPPARENDPQRTTLLDQFNVGETVQYNNRKDNRFASGEPTRDVKHEESSFGYSFRSRYEDECC